MSQHLTWYTISCLNSASSTCLTLRTSMSHLSGGLNGLTRDIKAFKENWSERNLRQFTYIWKAIFGWTLSGWDGSMFANMFTYQRLPLTKNQERLCSKISQYSSVLIVQCPNVSPNIDSYVSTLQVWHVSPHKHPCLTYQVFKRSNERHLSLWGKLITSERILRQFTYMWEAVLSWTISRWDSSMFANMFRSQCLLLTNS